MGKGRKAIPIALKIAAGNPSKRPLPPDDKVARGEPVKPLDLSDDESVLWDKIVGDIKGAGVLYVTDGEAITDLVRSLCVSRKAFSLIGDEYLVECGEEGADLKANPLWKIVHESWQRAIRLMTEFGLTPSSRVKLTGLQPDNKVNELKAFLEQTKLSAG